MDIVKCEVCGTQCKYQRKRFCSMECRAIAYRGTGNPFFGKKQSNTQKEAVRNHNTNVKDYNKVSSKLTGRTMPLETREKLSLSLKKWFSKNPNPMQDRHHTEETKLKISQRTSEQYLQSSLYKKRQANRGPYQSYYREVWRLTEQNDLSILENNDRRGYRQYHLDHILPIRVGFDSGIPANEIADIRNLQFLWWKANMNKRTKIMTIPNHLAKYYEIVELEVTGDFENYIEEDR